MKKITLLVFLIFHVLFADSQNAADAVNGNNRIADSSKIVGKKLNLKISNPQPRLNEKIQFTVDINSIRADIFKSELINISPTEDILLTKGNSITLYSNAKKIGKNEFGPLNFSFNGINYTTNKVEYDVIESFPYSEEGLWFRKIFTSDTTVCVIIEQLLTDKNSNEKEPGNAALHLTANLVKFNPDACYDGLAGNYTNYNGGLTDFVNLKDKNGTQKRFLKSIFIKNFTIIDKNKKIIITKDKFINIPENFSFENILIQ